LSGSQIVPRPTYEEFVGFLRSALHYLYDPVHLRRSPLVDLFGRSTAPDRAAALQRILTETIRSIKPSEVEPPQSAAWHIYDTLSLQYIRQFDRNVVANQLGISDRQLRRVQRLALEAMAQQLWQQFELDALLDTPLISPGLSDKTQALNTELGWLKADESVELDTVQETFRTIESLVQPLSTNWKTSVKIDILSGLEDIPVPQMALRSILLTILNALIPCAAGGHIEVNVSRDVTYIQTRIHCAPITSQEGLDSDFVTARQVAEFYKASLTIGQNAREFNAQLAILAPKQILILVVDDNADWLEMLKRYAVGTRYRVVTTRDPRGAAALAEKIQPALILLDVMMPNVDGWQVLSEIRQNQMIHTIPIVVCTVLPLADLSLSLGVNAFLQKPITQGQFLELLDQLTKTITD
jgi:CheY-like chemotaxis protein